MLNKVLIETSRPFRYALHRVTYALSGRASELEPLRGRYSGRPMLVVGNGPSLNRTPLEQFSAVPSIAMNKISMLFDRSPWRPTLIVCINGMVVKQHGEAFATSEVPVYLSWKNRGLMPAGHRDSVTYFLSNLSFAFSGDITRGVAASATVTSTALEFAYFMGADPVILFGVDHSFSQQGKMFQYDRRAGPDVDHFDPNYFKDGEMWGLPNLDSSEVSYRLARDAFAADGRRVLDATIGGRLQVFPKIDLDEALRLCSLPR